MKSCWVTNLSQLGVATRSNYIITIIADCTSTSPPV